MRRVQIVFNTEPHAAPKILSALADDQMVVGLFQHGFRNFRGYSYAFDRRDGAGLLLRPMHARGIKLHDAVRVRQTTVANTIVERIFFNYVHTGNDRFEHVVATRNHRESLLYAGNIAAILKFVSVG